MSMINHLHRSCMALVCCLTTVASYVPAARGELAQWATSDLDIFFYNQAVSAGSRKLAPSYLGDVEIDPNTQQFKPRTVLDPARLGMDLTAFNTSSVIPAGKAPNLYQITSVTFKATWTYNSDPTPLIYQDTPISQSEMLAEFANQNVTHQKPFELYGVGLRKGYTGYEFTSPTPGAPLLDELTHPYQGGNGYNAYPIVGSSTQPGQYVDVSNSVTGGYSETETCNLAVPCHSTAPFTATPWAIGKANLTSGVDEIDDNTTFTFTLDLNQPGVRAYVQQSLSNGQLGFFLSSLHSTGAFGSGGGYPKWYTKEAVNDPVNAPPAWLPQLTIDYQILPPAVPGDYDNNGVVDADDYVLWRKGGPLANQVDDPSHITPQDYVEWRARFGNSANSGSGSLLNGTTVPEPSSVILLMMIAPIFWRRKHGRVRI